MKGKNPMENVRYYKKDSPDTPETLTKEEACI